MDFGLPFLDDEGASQSEAFIRIVCFKSLPQGCHQTVAPSSFLCLNLYDLVNRKTQLIEPMTPGQCFFILSRRVTKVHMQAGMTLMYMLKMASFI